MVQRSPKTELSKNSSSSEDNGGFVTPPTTNNICRRSQVKRATIVGNPMFSNSPDNELCSESLGLDDLDMDYEQIMHYFDNLKVKLCSETFPPFLRTTLKKVKSSFYK